MMKIHILGIAGTFMSGVAVLAKNAGHIVSGSDANVYPPMSTQLESQGITLKEGYDPAHIDDDVDCVVVGNVIKRGNLEMEYVLNKQIPYLSGPEWLARYILSGSKVLAVSGTHGKTTTTSILTWILDAAGLNPGYLIGGVPENFGVSARLGDGSYFVIEADEYDSAFFDKRSKFIHYHPNILIINNLEFDHADIFSDLEAIKLAFHYLVRTVPGNGHIIMPSDDQNVVDVIEKGCWSAITKIGIHGDFTAELINQDGSAFNVIEKNKVVGVVRYALLGKHNVANALSAIAAASKAGVSPEVAIKALSNFKNVKRRLEVKGLVNGVTVYDDFAHHPTAVETTLSGLRAKIGSGRLIAVLEFGSYTMRTGVHKDRMREALADADMVVCRATTGDWGLENMLSTFKQPTSMYHSVDDIVTHLQKLSKTGDHIVVMSNSGFEGIHDKLLKAIANR